jgi:hypothetical protein
MKHLLPWLMLIGATTACLPDRRDVVAAGDEDAVDDVDNAEDVTQTTGDVKGDSKGDVPKTDVPLLGCKKDETCAGFGDACHTGVCDVVTGLCSVTPTADDSPCLNVVYMCGSAKCEAGTCVLTPTNACDDSKPCTVDTCDPATGCPKDQNPPIVIPMPATCGAKGNEPCDCDDNLLCTEGDKCNGATCTPGKARKCDDANACTTDSCVEGKGCVFAPLADGVACEDGDTLCTTGDSCKAGLCVGTPKNCGAAPNACTLRACVFQNGGCSNNPNVGAACDDGEPCTDPDACVDDFANNPGQGVCQGKPNACDDKNECTDDSCTPGVGCQHANNAGTCKLSDPCAPTGKCTDGACKAPDVSCDDGNACTDDACDAKKGCTHTNNTAPCNDGNPCTYQETCQSGVCGGPANAQNSLDVSVDDGNDCTNDACDPLNGPSWSIKSNGQGCGSSPATMKCVGGVCQPSNACGDGICGVIENSGSCLADCPVNGGQCGAADAACIDTCSTKACGLESTACDGDQGCTDIAACVKLCSDTPCTLACLIPNDPVHFPTNLQTWLNTQWCRNSQCVANSWSGKACVPGGTEYAACAAGCESALCLQTSLTCANISGCPARKTCLSACNGDPTCEANCTGDATSTAAAKALLQCTINACQ